ncbi:MAG: hypothetical protein LBU91_02540 [Bacteroidales bacterium]|jgi:hypothetical protein|nr:hypothetical protein [Bacteroidales bacterium]
MKKLILMAAMAAFMFACNNAPKQEEGATCDKQKTECTKKCEGKEEGKCCKEGKEGEEGKCCKKEGKECEKNCEGAAAEAPTEAPATK